MRYLMIGISMLWVAGCGMKGDLYLPHDQTAAGNPSAPFVVPAPRKEEAIA